MIVDLVDGTYELFRYHFGMKEPESRTAATRGVLGAALSLIQHGATHLGVATDHVIESFRNDLWPGYKTSAGMPEPLLAQFSQLEEALEALGVAVWPMVELEADDALASAAALASADPRVEQVRIHTVDKDLAQCVTGDRVVQVDRRKEVVLDEPAVMVRYGVAPESIPDWLALVGDSADGFPGLQGWGKKGAATVLARYRHLEDIPLSPLEWDIRVPGSVRMMTTLTEKLELALLFRNLATLRREPPVAKDVDSLRWGGPTLAFEEICRRVNAPTFPARAAKLAAARR